MKNLETLIIDIFDDVNLPQTMSKIASRIPENMRSVERCSFEERANLEDYQFGLSILTKHASKLNKFPLNDKLNTTLSNEYFEMNHHKLPFEAQRTAATYIKQACERFGIEPQESVKIAAAKIPYMTNLYIENMNDTPGGRLAPVEKTASAESENMYALVKTASDGSTSRAYAMPSPEHVKKAESYFSKYAKQFSPEDRHAFASTVFKRGLELGVKIEEPSVLKYAGLNYNPNLESALSFRRKLLSDNPDLSDKFSKLASYQSKTDPKTFAKVLSELDKMAGLDKYYDGKIEDPYHSTFGGTQKTASVIYDNDGLMMTEEDLVKVSHDTLKKYFGPTLADGLKKEGSAAFVALPETAKEVIARIANGEIS